MSRASHGSLTAIAVGTVAFSLSFQWLDSANAQFKPGNVFVSDPGYKRCMRGDRYGWDRIWEIDPYTGEVTLFAELRDEECGYLTGLVFTPDGCRLRASQLLTSRILEFDSQGHWTTAQDFEDGIVGPQGSNNIAYDQDGNFYVANYTGQPIMKYPADGGPGMVWADGADGIAGPGPLAVASSGDLFYGNWVFTAYLVKISPTGVVSLFDPLENFRWGPLGLAANRRGDLFMALSNGQLFKYDVAVVGSRSLVTNLPLVGPIALDPSETWLYVPVFQTTELISLHIATATLQDLATITGATGIFGSGIAVVPGVRGDIDRDGEVDAADFLAWAHCVGGPFDGFVTLDCSLLNLQGDSDVDLADFAEFQEVFGDRGPICR